ncbi:acyltransferase family protein [Microcella flavibacter]|uniref:acyltransferase family protein n=1 Tax=Microcella flavibacter TaxID=1804990 RepID=UPI0014567344|nr:acyltransferase family protein [Microcella flavibacter]
MSSSPATPPIGTRARLPGLDGVRALAVVLVLAYHLVPGLAPGGFVGVDVFLVVSGYLITALLLAEHAREGGIRLGRFWRRRARRLLPALLLVVGASAGVAALIGGDVLVGIDWQLLGAATFSSNWVAIAQGASYLDQTSPELLRHLWSLAVEEQFYLLWPLALAGLLVLPRRWMRVAVPVALAVASAVAMGLVAGDPAADGAAASSAYFSTLTHGFGLLVGAGLALARRPLALPADRAAGRIPAAVADAGAITAAVGIVALASILAIDGAAAYRGGMVAVVLLTAVLLLALDHPGGRVAPLIDRGPAGWVGERSYGLYLWHWPVVVLLGAALPGIDRTGATGWMLGLLALAISLPLAAGSYRWLEQPVRRHGLAALGVGRRAEVAPSPAAGSPSGAPSPAAGAPAPAPIARRPWAVALVATAVTALLLAGTTAAVVRAPAESQAAAAILAGQTALDELERRPAPTVPPEPLVLTAPSPAPTVPPGDEIIAIGDSVMLASAPALQERFPGILIDAAVSRQMRAAPDLLRGYAAAGELRSTVVLGLGTNGPIDAATLDEVRRILGPSRTLVLVSAQAPRDWTPGVNGELTTFAARFRAVELADWRSAIEPQLALLAGDQIHPGSAGARVYADAVDGAVRRLTALPRFQDYLADLS